MLYGFSALFLWGGGLIACGSGLLEVPELGAKILRSACVNCSKPKPALGRREYSVGYNNIHNNMLSEFTTYMFAARGLYCIMKCPTYQPQYLLRRFVFPLLRPTTSEFDVSLG